MSSEKHWRVSTNLQNNAWECFLTSDTSFLLPFIFSQEFPSLSVVNSVGKVTRVSCESRRLKLFHFNASDKRKSRETKLLLWRNRFYHWLGRLGRFGAKQSRKKITGHVHKNEIPLHFPSLHTVYQPWLVFCIFSSSKTAIHFNIINIRLKKREQMEDFPSNKEGSSSRGKKRMSLPSPSLQSLVESRKKSRFLCFSLSTDTLMLLSCSCLTLQSVAEADRYHTWKHKHPSQLPCKINARK